MGGHGLVKGGIEDRDLGHAPAQQLVGGTQVDVVTERAQHGQQQVGRVQALAVDPRHRVVFVEGLEEAADQDGLA